MRVIPSLNAGVPQIRITPDLEKLANSGLSARDFTTAVDVFNDGVTVAQVPIDGKLVDLVLGSERAGSATCQHLKSCLSLHVQVHLSSYRKLRM